MAKGFLRDLRIKRVALVDMGANFDKQTGDGAHIMIYKAGPSVADVHVDTTDWESEYEKANLDASTRNSLPDSAFAAVWTDAQGKKHRKLPIHDAGHLAAARGRIDQADIPADVKAAARSKIESATNHKEKSHVPNKNVFKRMLDAIREPDVEKRNTALAAIEKEFPDDAEVPMHKADDPTCKCADCMSKRAPVAPEVTELSKRLTEIEKNNVELQKANTELQGKIKAEIEKRLDGEMVTLLKSFSNTSLDLTKDVAVFRKMKEDNPEGFERTIAILKAQDAALMTSKLFEDVGTRRGAGEGSPWAQIEAKAEALMEKSTGKMTKEAAIEKVMLDPANKALIKEYRAQQ